MWFQQQKPLKKWLKSQTLYVVCALHRHLCHGNIAMAHPGNAAYCGTRANAAGVCAGDVYEGLGMNKCHSAHPVIHQQSTRAGGGERARGLCLFGADVDSGTYLTSPLPTNKKRQWRFIFLVPSSLTVFLLSQRDPVPRRQPLMGNKRYA